MRLEEMKLQTSPFLEGYLQADLDVARFFDYQKPYNKQEWMKRHEELKHHPFPRKELTEYLFTYNEKIGSSRKTMDAIQKLNNPETVTVVGGQQAGLLTGPLLVIYKCISIIQLAKQAEKELGMPVVPVFWIAGEDHDMDEINHIMLPKNNTAKKTSFKEASAIKSSASLWKWNTENVKPWIAEVFRSFGETAYTQDFKIETERILDESDSIVTFFAKLLTKWFSDEGLIFLDSGDPDYKKLQTPYLEKIIKNNSDIDEAFRSQSKELNKFGFDDPIEIQSNNAHLFYSKEEERILLYREGSSFTSKEKDFTITEDQLLKEAAAHPERFSNNVVTRPLMQEFLLPTLSFIAGPGEIAYWATLGKVFHLFDRKMPILTPRLSVTLVPEKTTHLLEEKGLVVSQVLENGTDEYKRDWFNKNRPVETNETIQTVKAEIADSYSQLIKLASKIDENLLPVTEKNLDRIYAEIEYIEKKMEQRVRKKVKEPLAQFDELMLELKPVGSLQERVWNIYQYMNEFGPDLIRQLVQYPFIFNEKHKIIYL
ncbi:bacillithiol biosynthesis cysteine-adding enzyme BshC [Bacillus sp. NEB1478]|uniref:bacillithiol biosynthesis cysteine-adding enzyme BshC n=1 Tax=Bacillus sp. NEB1478 TaxID=3073816 RepID=UPI0028736636|nr:bacillithiol biosynthesis cysteine-adding enzyme BshC [Bacillus sp. NEB1478]WNB90495.1 bacillithiol biosynthesis cysteine-adding enzyme BshC [Bacillus sp. NEB1478]